MTSKFDSLKVSPEEFYKSGIDPFKIKRSRIEKNKARLFGLHIRNCNPSVVLDIGCGEGHFTEYYNSFIPEATFYGCDVSDTAIERAVGLGSSVRYFNQDLCGRHPEKYLKHKFDTVICSEVLYYLPNDQMNKAVNMISMFGRVTFDPVTSTVSEQTDNEFRNQSIDLHIERPHTFRLGSKPFFYNEKTRVLCAMLGYISDIDAVKERYNIDADTE